MRLNPLLDGIATPRTDDMVVSGLTLDSRSVRPGDAFVALAGARHHGIEFAPVALARGAVVVLAETHGPAARDQERPVIPASGSSVQAPAAGANEHKSRSTPVSGACGPPSPVPGPASSIVWIDRLRSHLGAIAARFFDDPSAALTVVGVTGTNGKTSTVQLLAQAFTHLGRRVATIGTLGAGMDDALEPGERTTPDVIRVHGLLAGFRDAGATHVAMEVSSHALDQQRVDGVHFDVAVFTNLTRDHLDYHGTMEAYGAAKARLFAWPSLRAVVLNVDDAFGRKLAREARSRISGAGPGVVPARAGTAERVFGYGIESDDADIRARGVDTHSDGIDFELATPWGLGSVHSQLVGRFNVANLLAVAGTLGALGTPFAQVRATLEMLQPVPGRMNRLGGGARPLVVVDYSHTPDALEQALKTLREHCNGKLICVFGCGGERDTGKRPLMGAVTERLADVVIITDDNPRGEDGDAIVAQITAGLQSPQRATVERDRACAIALALAQAHAGDVVLIAGKGHEAYQERSGIRRPFDDLVVARSALEARAC